MFYEKMAKKISNHQLQQKNSWELSTYLDVFEMDICFLREVDNGTKEIE